MMVPNVLMWAASAIAAVWKIAQLVRAPQDKGLRVVAVCTVLVFIALSAQLAISVPVMSGLFPEQSPKLIQNVILTFFFALLIVLLQSAASPETVGSRGRIEVALALLTSGALVATFVATSPAVRGASYEDANGHAGVLAFYLLGNLYMSYATARGAYLAWTTAGQTQSRARLSLRVAAAGLVVNCLGTHMPRVVSTSGRLAIDRDPLPGTETWTTPFLAIGIVAFFLGIGYPGARTGIVKARLWFEMRRHYRQLRPLWIAVCGQFPNIALFPPTSPIREAFQVRHMRLRYYRRVIECRDGLVCLSPYIAEPVDSATSPAQQAELVRDALARSSQGREPVSAASVIAAPAVPGMDADTNELLVLSQTLDRLT
ncbi:MAB_1171c family putative transporter [Saccharopolyspora phatthalungensis]|nr:MAB_1171c family putative transporter [Saccharopolyspora phatthalungensis]